MQFSRTMYQKKKSHLDLERESPQLSGTKRKFAAFLHEAEWLLFVVDGWFSLYVCFASPSVFLSCPVLLIFSVSFPRHIYYCWNVVVRCEKWEWSLSRGYVFKRRWFAVLSTTLVSLSLRFQCDFHDKEHLGSLVYWQGVWAGLWVGYPLWGRQQMLVLIFVGTCLTVFPLPGFLRVVFVLLVEGWFLPWPVWLVKMVGDSSPEGLFLVTVFRESLWRWSWLDFTKVVPDGP